MPHFALQSTLNQAEHENILNELLATVPFKILCSYQLLPVSVELDYKFYAAWALEQINKTENPYLHAALSPLAILHFEKKIHHHLFDSAIQEMLNSFSLRVSSPKLAAILYCLANIELIGKERTSVSSSRYSELYEFLDKIIEVVEHVNGILDFSKFEQLYDLMRFPSSPDESYDMESDRIEKAQGETESLIDRCIDSYRVQASQMNEVFVLDLIHRESGTQLLN